MFLKINYLFGASIFLPKSAIYISFILQYSRSRYKPVIHYTTTIQIAFNLTVSANFLIRHFKMNKKNKSARILNVRITNTYQSTPLCCTLDT